MATSSKFIVAVVVIAIIVYMAFPNSPTVSSDIAVVDEQGDIVTPDKMAMEACLSIWSDPAYLQSLQDEGIAAPTDPEATCKVILAEEPQPSYMSDNLFFVPDYDDFVKFDSLSDEQLTEMGFFNVSDDPELRGDQSTTEQKNIISKLTDSIGDALKRAPPCNCRWVTTSFISPNPIKTASYTQPAKGSGTHFGNSFSLGSVHGMIDNLTNNCFGTAGNVTNEDGVMILTSKVACRPTGCCTPAGSTKSISAYRSNVGVNTGSSFCFFASTFGNALAADAVQYFVDGVSVPGGSGAAMATSGSTVAGSINLGVGGGAQIGPTGPTLSGTGSLAVTASQIKADGKAAAPLVKMGSKVNTVPSMVAELQTGGRTQANITRKAVADAEQLSNIGALGMFGKETACGAGNFDVYRYQYSNGPNGRAAGATFKQRYKLLRDQFLP